MAIALLRKQNLGTCRHLFNSTSPSFTQQTKHHYQHSREWCHHHHQQQHVNYYSRFSNLFRRGGKAVDVPVAPPFAFSYSSSSSSSSAVSRIGFIGWYLGMVKSRPVFTKSVTSCLIYIAADLTSQTIALTSSDSYDFIRTSRMAGYGMVILGPSLHYWFNFMSKILPGTGLLTTAKKMALGQTLFGPLMTVIFFSLNAALQGEDTQEIMARLKRDLLPTMLNGVMYWPICDFITFRFVPVHLQPLVSNSFSYVWTIYMTYMAGREKAAAV